MSSAVYQHVHGKLSRARERTRWETIVQRATGVQTENAIDGASGKLKKRYGDEPRDTGSVPEILSLLSASLWRQGLLSRRARTCCPFMECLLQVA